VYQQTIRVSRMQYAFSDSKTAFALYFSVYGSIISGSLSLPHRFAASLLAGTKAAEVGYSQVLWMDALDRKYLEEVGTMNIFVKFDDELVTPPLSSSILSGITRDSVLTLTRDMGFNVNERQVSIDEVIEGIKSGKVVEMFGCGTAAIIAPVGALWFEENNYNVSDGKTGKLTQHLFDEITGIQSGERPDPYGWIVEVD